jgi:hemerythrin superfamily protein
MNALALLRQDHSAIKTLLSKFERTVRTAHDKRNELFIQIRRELQIHTKAEEEIFYPALKALNGSGRSLVSQALKEHRDIEELLTQLSRMKPSDRNFDDKMETLIENVDHHVEEEEGEIFQFAQENCTPDQLDDIGGQLIERKRYLIGRLAA